MRLNMLDPSLPLEYPVNVFYDVFDKRQAVEYDTLANFTEKGAWEEALHFIEDHHHLINTSRLQRRPKEGDDGSESGTKTLLWTPLHWAASSEYAGVDIIERLLHFGALKSLETGLGETAYDIAVGRNRTNEILELLEVPHAVKENKEAIEKMKEMAQKIIEDRVGDIIKENGMQLPQIQILWEVSNECGESMMYPVLGMRGGYSLDLDVEENKLYIVGWTRADGGEEIRHVINSKGEAKDISDVLDELHNSLN